MGEAARVTSIESVQTFAAALRGYQEASQAALESLELEIRRAVEWIGHDRKQHWEERVRRGWDEVSEARGALERARLTRKVADHRPSCIEERKALETAKRRLQLAQEKVEAVRHWTRVIDHEVHEYQSGISQFVTWLETDLPRGVEALQRMLNALAAYAEIQPASVVARPARPARKQPSPDEETPPTETSTEMPAEPQSDPPPADPVDSAPGDA